MLISRLTICDAPAISLISARLTEATDIRERAAEQPSFRLCVAFDHHLLYNLPTTSHPEQPGGRLIGLGGEQRRRCIQVEHATELTDSSLPCTEFLPSPPGLAFQTVSHVTSSTPSLLTLCPGRPRIYANVRDPGEKNKRMSSSHVEPSIRLARQRRPSFWISIRSATDPKYN